MNTPEPQPDAAAIGSSGASRRLWAGLALVVLVIAIAAGYLWMSTESAPVASVPKKIAVVGIPQVKEADDGFEEKMIELGYADAEFIEREVVIGPTFEQNLQVAIQEFIDGNVDLIFANFEAPAKVAQTMTAAQSRTDIPIVFISRLHDPVTMKLIDSFQSSGNNLTGIATNLSHLIQRHLQFIKDIDPNATKLGVFGKGFQVPSVAGEYFETVKREAPKFGLTVVEYTTDAPPPQAKAEFERIAAGIEKGDIDALMHIGGHYYSTQEAGESELAIRLGIPMATNYEDMPRGGHFTLSNGTYESGQQAAVVADKIFKGALPADIPIEYAQKEILSLHAARARTAGITFPDTMRYLADNIYEDDSMFPAFENH
ncbi:MAG TPA: ABC transporter substrate binding protein [Candidatus Paceibacterota bacterium]